MKEKNEIKAKKQDPIAKSISRDAKSISREIFLFIIDILYNATVIIILVVIIRSFIVSPFRVVGSSMLSTLHSNEFILINKFNYLIGEPKNGDPVVFKPPATNKYPHKFEESITLDKNGEGSLYIGNLRTPKNVVYCQNSLVKKLWFCKDSVDINDLIFYKPINSGDSWNNAEESIVSKEDISNKELLIKGNPNKSYSIRIYNSEGPEYYVKRIIGIPGDTIKIENGRVYLKKPNEDVFNELKEDYLNNENKNNTYFIQSLKENTFLVPEKEYFVLGDNRNHSNDSRSWFAPITQVHTPFVPLKNLNGKVLVVLWPLTSIRFISGL